MKIFKKILGVFFIILGVLIHLIPLMPGSWLIVLGLELLGVHLLVWDKVKSFLYNKKSFKNEK